MPEGQLRRVANFRWHGEQKIEYCVFQRQGEMWSQFDTVELNHFHDQDREQIFFWTESDSTATSTFGPGP